MFQCTIHDSAERAIVALAGNLTLEHAREIHAALLPLETRSGLIILDLTGSDASDVSFIQIMHSLMQHPMVRFFPLPSHMVELAASLGANTLIKEISHRTEEHA